MQDTLVELAKAPVVAVFGSSAPQPGSADYEQARAVGRLLAKGGFVVATGGYEGTMAAASQGAADEGGYVIGVVSRRIEAFRSARLNRWVQEVVRYENQEERLLHLVHNNVGMIVCPGGIGTLSELTLAWSFLQVGEIEPRPLVLLGEIWRRTMEAFIHSDYVSKEHAALLRYADSPAEAVAEIEKGRQGTGRSLESEG